MSERTAQGWDLTAYGRRHRVEIIGSVSRTVKWFVDGELVAVKKSFKDDIQLTPGDGRPNSDATGSAAADEAADEDAGAVGVKFSPLGHPRRVTWYCAEDDVSASAAAVLGMGGIDLDPAPGSPAARREERIRRHPRRHAAVAVAGGIGKVVVPLLLGLLVVRLAISLPWPDWTFPSIPWPHVDLPSIPWPEVDLPDWKAPAWVLWILDKVKYVWPILLAWFLARLEIQRRREQDKLKARLKAEAAGNEKESTPKTD